jgi:3-dehydroquinate synthase
VPTTLMAVVDASIGIKTAINFHSKKNKLGTYCPPLGVFYDTAFLNTLDGRNLSNGSAEVLKMACIKDGALFELMEAHAEELLGGKYQVGGVVWCGVGGWVVWFSTCWGGWWG